MTAKNTPIRRAASVTSELVRVSPTLAGEWIANNVKNRNIRQQHVTRLALDMSNSDWHFTGEPLKFDYAGNLIDGQHRLMAVIRSGRTIEFLVLRGLQPIAQDFMDSGAKRTAADMLSLRGHVNSNLLASTARFGINLEQQTANRNAVVTHAQIATFIDANPDLADACRMANGVRPYLPFKPTALAWAFLQLNRVDTIETAAFFDSLANNATKGKGDPRNTLLRRMSSAKRADESLSTADEVSFIIRAWNAWRKGSPLTILKSRAAGGAGPDGIVRVSIPRAV
jgi:hypothetical protein